MLPKQGRLHIFREGHYIARKCPQSSRNLPYGLITSSEISPRNKLVYNNDVQERKVHIPEEGPYIFSKNPTSSRNLRTA